MGTRYAVGDRVKVTVEGEVTRVMNADPDGTVQELRIEAKGGAESHYVYSDSASVEKVEPAVAVEVFKPGEVVRARGEGSLWAIGQDGYMRLGGRGYPAQRSDGKFTSEDYERVEIG